MLILINVGFVAKKKKQFQKNSNLLSLTWKFQSLASSQGVSEKTIHNVLVAGKTFEKELKFIQQPACDLKAEFFFLNEKTFFFLLIYS